MPPFFHRPAWRSRHRIWVLHPIWQLRLGLLIGRHEVQGLLAVLRFLKAADIVKVGVKRRWWPRAKRPAFGESRAPSRVSLVTGSGRRRPQREWRNGDPQAPHLPLVQNVSTRGMDIKVTSAPPTAVVGQVCFRNPRRGFDPQPAMPVAVNTEHRAPNQRHGNAIHDFDGRTVTDRRAEDRSNPRQRNHQKPKFTHLHRAAPAPALLLTCGAGSLIRGDPPSASI